MIAKFCSCISDIAKFLVIKETTTLVTAVIGKQSTHKVSDQIVLMGFQHAGEEMQPKHSPPEIVFLRCS